MPCSITFSEVNVHFLCLHGVYGNQSDSGDLMALSAKATTFSSATEVQVLILFI